MTATESSPAQAIALVESDPRLGPIWSLVQQPHVTTLSLDVFDTILWRTVSQPAHAFAMLAPGLRAAGILKPDVTDPSFARLRVEAEWRARQLSDSQGKGVEVTLAEIWAQLSVLVGRDRVPEAIAAELALEARVCLPDHAVVAFAGLVRSKLDKRVQLVSDTYLSAEQLRGILLSRAETAGLATLPLATSSEWGVAKGDGLFPRLLSAWSLTAGEVVHLGDNERSDVEAARNAGIRGVLLPAQTVSFWRVLVAEGVHGAPHGDPKVTDPVQGDMGLRALRSRVVQGPGSAEVAPHLEPFWRTGAAVIGPALAGFGTWVHERARAHGAARVLCPRREGDFLADIIDRCSPAATLLGHAPVSAVPVWASRRACLTATLVNADADELGALLVRRSPTTVNAQLADLNVPVSMVPSLRSLLHTRVDLPGVQEEVLEVLSGSAQVRQLLLDRARSTQQRLAAHLERHFPAEGPIVLVDIGWGATVQRLLTTMYEQMGQPREIVGLYLATHWRAEQFSLDGIVTEGFLAHHGQPDDLLAPLQRSPEIMEQACLSGGGSLIGFDADLEPVTAPDLRPPAQQVSRDVVQTGVRAFVSRWVAELAEAPDLLDLTTPAARLRLLRQLSRFVSLPLEDEALAFGSWIQDDNLATEAAEVLLNPDALARVRSSSVYDIAALRMSNIYWPSGAAVLTEPTTAALLDLVMRKEVDVRDVSPASEGGHVEVYVDEGEDFHRGPWVHVSARVVGNARIRIRAELEVSGVHRLRLDPGDSSGLLRLDDLFVTLHTRTDPEALTLAFREGSEPGFAVGGARQVGPGLWEVTDGDPMIVVEPGLISREVHRRATDTVLLEVELIYAFLPLEHPLQLPAPEPWTVEVPVVVPAEVGTRTAARIAARGVAAKARRTLRPPG